MDSADPLSLAGSLQSAGQLNPLGQVREPLSKQAGRVWCLEKTGMLALTRALWHTRAGIFHAH